MIDYNMSWDDYRAFDALNGSTLAHILASPLEMQYRRTNGIQPPREVTRPGSALHSIVELLPESKFHEQFTVMPNFKRDPGNVNATTGERSYTATNWTRDQEARFAEEVEENGKEVLPFTEYQRVARMIQAIVDTNLDTIDSVFAQILRSKREVSVHERLGTVLCKGRIDGLLFLTELSCKQWSLKTCGAGVGLHDFRRVSSNLHYMFKDAMHWLLLRQYGLTPTEFSWFVIDDCKPIDKGLNAGKFPHAPQCVEVTLDTDKLSAAAVGVMAAIKLYEQCERKQHWPGVEKYEYIPYDSEIPQLELEWEDDAEIS